MSRRPLVVGNWKMYKRIADARDFTRALVSRTLPGGVDVVICPPFTALAAVAKELDGSPVMLGAQTMHEGLFGPYTGEISAPMLREIGVRFVLLGHSERRSGACESDIAIAHKTVSALEAGITPVVIVGESREEHDAGKTRQKVVGQMRIALGGLRSHDVARCVAAYEPIWAIGTGVSDDPSENDLTMAELRACVPGLKDVRFLYGGSVKPDNAAAFFAQPNIDGGLVGSASLDVDSFLAIVAAAA